jgi:hypothetical protein
MEMHKIYEYEWERYIRLDEYEKSTKLLRAEIRNLKDDLDRIEEIKDREWIKLLNENERVSKELEKKERAWRKLKKQPHKE